MDVTDSVTFHDLQDFFWGRDGAAVSTGVSGAAAGVRGGTRTGSQPWGRRAVVPSLLEQRLWLGQLLRGWSSSGQPLLQEQLQAPAGSVCFSVCCRLP